MSGAPRHVFILSQALKKRGHNITVVCPPGAMINHLREAKIKVEVIAMGSPLDRKADHKIRAVLERLKPDIVHCHGLRGGWLGRLAARKLKSMAMVYTEHLWTKDYHLTNRVWEEFQLRGLKLMDRFTDVTIAISGSVKAFLLERKITPRGKLVVIPNMLNPDFIGPKKYQKPSGLPKIIGSIGSLNIQKGYLALLEALKILREKKLPLDWRCQIIGTGPLEKIIRRRIKKFKLSSWVTVKPSVDDVIETMRHFSCYAQNSRAETAARAVVEAMVLGVPVIVANRGALPEVVRHGETGLVVPYGKPEQLADALSKILLDDNLARRLGEAGRREVLRRFAAKPTIDRIEKVYAKALSNRRFKRHIARRYASRLFVLNQIAQRVEFYEMARLTFAVGGALISRFVIYRLAGIVGDVNNPVIIKRQSSQTGSSTIIHFDFGLIHLKLALRAREIARVQTAGIARFIGQ